MKEEQRGVSLIALVITIITVMILAAIVFNTATNSRSYQSKTQYCPTCGRAY